MHPEEPEEIARVAKAAKPPASALLAALQDAPEHVRVVAMGHELLAAFVLAELPGGVEEISGLAFSEAGMSAGAERAAVEYVVGAARFGGKKAVEVVARTGSAEARHLEREGFKPAGKAAAGEQRFRLALKG